MTKDPSLPASLSAANVNDYQRLLQSTMQSVEATCLTSWRPNLPSRTGQCKMAPAIVAILDEALEDAASIDWDLLESQGVGICQTLTRDAVLEMSPSSADGNDQ